MHVAFNGCEGSLTGKLPRVRTDLPVFSIVQSGYYVYLIASRTLGGLASIHGTESIYGMALT